MVHSNPTYLEKAWLNKSLYILRTLLKILEGSGWEAIHDGITKLSRELNEHISCRVVNNCTQHVCGLWDFVGFDAVFTPPETVFVRYLFAAIGTSHIVDLIFVKNNFHEATDFEKLWIRSDAVDILFEFSACHVGVTVTVSNLSFFRLGFSLNTLCDWLKVCRSLLILYFPPLLQFKGSRMVTIYEYLWMFIPCV